MASGKIIILTAPSGAGKTSITRYLLQHNKALGFSVSAATRSPRPNEINGKDYHFMSTEDFQKKIEENAFIEWEMVYEGKYYGTLKSEIDRLWSEGKTPVLDIDVQGAIHVQKQYPNQCLSLFIDAPSIEVLNKRLVSRGSETAESIAARLNKATYELTFKQHFDRVIVNDDLAEACKTAEDAVNHFLNSTTNYVQ